MLLADNPVLREMLESGETRTASGAPLRISDTSIPATYAEALYRAVAARKPKTAVEIGMACSVSSLAIITALEKAGVVRLISIDPNQTAQWNSSGVEAVRRAGLNARHQLLEAPDFLALPRLLEQGTKIEFAYIDGWHTFDYTLLDFWYVDQMLLPGGGVGFNDCGFEAVHKVIKFALSHRHYLEIDSGLPATYAPHSRRQKISKLLLGRFGQLRERMMQDRYFVKQDDWQPDWNYYAEF